MRKEKFDNSLLRILLPVYKCVWVALLPLVCIYFIGRSKSESSYRKKFLERLGVSPNFERGLIWIHAVSLGELRAAIPLIRGLLNRSEKLIITTITPAGREEAERNFVSEIKNKKILLIYLPLEYGFAFHQFFKRYKPKLGIILEYELWPVMIQQSIAHKVPLVLAQAQYVEKSFVRDKKWPRLRGSLLDGFKLILAKSDIHAQRFRSLSNTPVDVMGELRFEQPVNIDHLNQAKSFSTQLKLKEGNRVSFCFGSTGPGEDEGLIKVMLILKERAEKLGEAKPFFVYVPRHKKDFTKIKEAIDASTLNFMSRTKILNSNLESNNISYSNILEIDGLFGDSLGEINFYFHLADFVFIGNSFNNLGSHNIIEPLALQKPVVVGPSTWGIEYPFKEAIAEEVVKKVSTFEDLTKFWTKKLKNPRLSKIEQDKMHKFYGEHAGAVKRCIQKLKENGLLY